MGSQVQFIEKRKNYELILMDDFPVMSSSSDPNCEQFVELFSALKDCDKNKELHIFINSYGGSVDTLNILLQQIIQFKYRVGICCGIACSCGCDLLFTCNERYISPFSQVLYHDISISQNGDEKISNVMNVATFSKEWSEEIDRVSCIRFFLTNEEKEKGRLSDVYFTGKELIARGACKDYSEYLNRHIPERSNDVIQIGNDLWKLDDDGSWIKFQSTGKKTPTPDLFEFVKNNPGKTYRS